MTILGQCIDISSRLSEKQAITFSQWIGCANVVRNQKITGFKQRLAAGETLDQAYSAIRKHKDLSFLQSVPVQVLRNASASAYTDVQACLKGLRKFPKIKPKHKKRSCIVTTELFIKEPLADNQTRICIYEHGKKGREFLFSIIVDRQPNAISNQLRLSRQGAKFWVSFSFDDDVSRASNDELLSNLSHLDQAELLNVAVGLDRGIKRHIQTSNGLTIAYSPKEQAALRKQSQRKARYQRILARKKRTNGNKGKGCETGKQKKLQQSIRGHDRKILNIRLNADHHKSKALVKATPGLLVLENLNLIGMTKRAKPKQDNTGRKYLRNNGRAKSGLNRSLLHVSLGRLSTFTKYKLNLDGKAWLDVTPYNTSKIHAECGERDTQRPNQATLICNKCEVTVQADENAALVIRDRGIYELKSGTFSAKKKPKKSITRRRKPAAASDSRSVKNQPSLAKVALKQHPLTDSLESLI